MRRRSILTVEESVAEVESKSLDKNNFDLLNIIEVNNFKEHDSIQEYYKFLSYAETCFDNGMICECTWENIKDSVFEIIGDELNHSEKLKIIAYNLSNISPNIN